MINVTERPSDSGIMRLAKGTADQVAVHTDRVLWRVAEHFPFLNRVVAGRERSLARAQCEQMLDICHALKADDPKLEGEALYERAVAKQLSCDETKARQIVRLADQSFAQWPDERDVNLRDVANYMIVNQIMNAHTTALGTRVDVEQLVAAVIPKGI